MKIDQKIGDRFQELIICVDELMKTRTARTGSVTRYPGGGALVSDSSDYVNEEMITQWATSCLHLLQKVFGKESDHYQNFRELAPLLTDYSDGTKTVKKALGVLKAAKDDFEHGFLFDTRALIQAEVFDDFLEQASHLLDTGYYGPAAVIGGIVLEEGLRRHCRQNDVAIPARATIGPMNDALAKTGLYNNVLKKKISALAEIRNQAAHGQWKEFNMKDVEQMIDWLRIFLENSFGDVRVAI